VNNLNGCRTTKVRLNLIAFASYSPAFVGHVFSHYGKELDFALSIPLHHGWRKRIAKVYIKVMLITKNQNRLINSL